jgi:hypothetical protein
MSFFQMSHIWQRALQLSVTATIALCGCAMGAGCVATVSPGGGVLLRHGSV